MSLSSFGYFTVHSDKLADWEEYGTRFLGLQLAEKTSSQLKFRMDDRKQRIVVSSEPEFATAFGWEVEDCGESEAARAIEPLAMLWCIRGFRENQWVHAFKLLKHTV